MKANFGLPIAIFTYFLFLTKPCAQGITPDQFYKYEVGFSSFKGFILPHSADVHHLMYGRPGGVELFASKSTTGSRPWQKRYNYPDYGLLISYFDTEMKPTGKLYYGLAFMKFYLIRWKNGGMTLRAGTGLTYAPTRYHKSENNLNNMISSIFTYNMQGRLGFEIGFHKQWYFQPSLTLSHASNGSLKLPNAGINIITGNLALGYRFKPMVLSSPAENTSNSTSKSFHYNFLISGAPKEIYPTGGKKYGFWTIRSYVDKPLNEVSRLVAGAELFFNRSLIEEIRRDETTPNSTDYKRAAVVVGHELVVSNISVMVQAGHYFLRSYNKDGDPDFYQRYGLKYYFNKKYFITTMLKAHGGRADNYDFGLGIRI